MVAFPLMARVSVFGVAKFEMRATVISPYGYVQGPLPWILEVREGIDIICLAWENAFVSRSADQEAL
ncbi:MAG: hypothetical protein EA399_01260 [Desulfovibrionales bacterium]|nr:MAG: hypothetical protein EA399_01260 [Desulfovibrionales bacterium]